MSQIGDKLTQEDCDCITVGRCPVCNHPGFRLGPQGGVAINIECMNPTCRSRFNAVMFGGRCLMAQAIPRGSEGGGAWPTSDEEGRTHRGTFS